jgi:hypothetical protein
MASNLVRSRLYGSAAFVSAVFALTYSVLALLFAGHDIAASAGIACLMTLALEQARRWKIRQLERALNSADRSRMNTISINGVRVGEINDADLIAMKLDAALDARSYVSQFAALATFVGRSVVGSAVVIPIALFWWLVLSAYFEPFHTLTNLAPIYRIFAQASNLSAAVPILELIARTIVNLGATTSVIAVGLLIAFSNRFPVRNAFREAVDRRLRLVAQCAADGALTVAHVPAETVQAGVFVDRTRVLR